MSQFNRVLFTDLHIKIDKMTAVLNGLTMSSKIGSNFKKETVEMLNSIRGHILTIYRKRYLASPDHNPNMIVDYRSLADDVMEIELYRYLAIVNYREEVDGKFEVLLTRIYKEIGSLQTCPFVSTFSNSDTYYWAEIGSGMIALPYGEQRNILNLSDLYHEIGHFLYDQYSQDFIGDLPSRMDIFFKKKLAVFTLAPVALTRWKNMWMEEFACDLIATYLTGPAYAWTNLKITTANSVLKVFGNGNLQSSHPANEARMRAIFAMLRLTGHTEALVEIEHSWADFLKNISAKPPANYEDTYPQQFIDVLAQSVLEGCRNIALRSYIDQISLEVTPVSLIINQGWNIIHTRNEDFKSWEENKVSELGFEV